MHLHRWHILRHMGHAARFNQSNPAFGPVFGGGPTIWMGGTAPSFYEDHLYVVTGWQPCLSSGLLIAYLLSMCCPYGSCTCTCTSIAQQRSVPLHFRLVELKQCWRGKEI